MKTKRVFADLPEPVVNRFLSIAKDKGSTGKAEIAAFVNQTVTGERVSTSEADTPDNAGNDPLAGLSTEDAQLVRRLIAAIRSGALEDSQTIDRLLRAFEATHKDETETTAKGKKHRRSA